MTGRRRTARRPAGPALGAVGILLAGLVLAGAGTTALPAPPAAAASCTATSGVTVVVDFGRYGGVRKACAPGNPSSGLSALHAAGFGTTGTQHDGAGFVCRIAGVPSAAHESCVDTPPGNAYWSYWHGQRGSGRWSYSSYGAAGSDPAPGTVEGWSFGAGAAPGLSVAAALPASHPASRPTGRSGGHGHGGGSGGGSGDGSGDGSGGGRGDGSGDGGGRSGAGGGGRDHGGGAGGTAGSGGRGSSGSAGASPGTSGRAPSGGPGSGGDRAATVSATPVAAQGRDGGGGLPPAATVGVLVVIWAVGMAAGIVAWRRRRRAS